MKRHIYSELQEWKDSPVRKPLLIRGARQIGKTYCIRHFGKQHFNHILEINFELEPKYKAYFSDLNPKAIINQLNLNQPNENITPGKTLLFLDEIQECPQAIMALRYFKELMPELHVIAAGSLLEFALNKEAFRMPVGRIEYRHMYPMNFAEFLMALGHQKLHDHLNNIQIHERIAEPTHQTLTDLFRQYLILGGMPEVVSAYKQTEDYSTCTHLQKALLNTYRNDFGKYTNIKALPMIETLFMQTPKLVGQIFKYSHVSPDYRSRELKQSLAQLVMANLVTPVYDTRASGLPLQTTVNEKKFKLNFLDTGLVTMANQLSANLLLNKDFFALNRGAIMEQFVGQELLAYSDSHSPGELFFWTKDAKNQSKAEIDYVMQIDGEIIPIEVKAGTTGRLKSMQTFLEDKSLTFGIRISLRPFELHKNILSLPAYMIHQLDRLAKEVIVR
jgi:predicted AAA+ superfamily ATPase